MRMGQAAALESDLKFPCQGFRPLSVYFLLLSRCFLARNAWLLKPELQECPLRARNLADQKSGKSEKKKKKRPKKKGGRRGRERERFGGGGGRWQEGATLGQQQNAAALSRSKLDIGEL